MLWLSFLTGAMVCGLAFAAGLYFGSRLSHQEPIPPFDALDRLAQASPEDLDRSDEREYEIERAKRGEPEV